MSCDALVLLRFGAVSDTRHVVHPITVVLNVFWHWKATGLKVSKVIGIQNQEWNIGHVKQLKSDRYQDRNFFFSSIAYVHPYFPKK